MTTLAVLTSGGDAPGMNAAVRAFVKVAAGRGARVLGVERGYDGLMEGRFTDLVPGPDLDPSGAFGGTILGAARSERFRTPEGRAEAAGRLRDAGVSGLAVIGGNGSLTGAHLLTREQGVATVGLPASIDNDIGCTAMAIGVDTALNTIVEACDRISDTARAHRRAFVVEVMGRDCGYLAMASAVAAGADAVLFREQDRSDAEIVELVRATIEKGFARGRRRVLVIKSEGVAMPCTDLVRALDALIDLPGVDVRATVLGHLVRGGSPSYQDRMIAGRLALGAVQALLEHKTDVMAAWQPVTPGGERTVDPSVQLFPLSEVLEQTAALLDGSSPITRKRIELIEGIEGVLGL